MGKLWGGGRKILPREFYHIVALSLEIMFLIKRMGNCGGSWGREGVWSGGGKSYQGNFNIF
jgi:hypothetical protein